MDSASPPPPQVDREWVRPAPGDCDDPGVWETVSKVYDGDTFYTKSGDSIRFLMIDTPELKSDDCQAWKARDYTASMLPPGTQVCLLKDKVAGDKDMYNRWLRYVFFRHEGELVMLNTRLLRLGHARVFDYFIKGLRYEEVAEWMQDLAIEDHLGGWKNCTW